VPAGHTRTSHVLATMDPRAADRPASSAEPGADHPAVAVD